MRDILIRVAGIGIFRARWTNEILDEVFRNLQANRPDIDPEKFRRTRQLMCRAIDDCLVTGYEGLVESLILPDPDDRHVLAAAIKCGAQVIVTENKRDFPQHVMNQYDIEIQGADEFLCDQIDLHSTLVTQAVTYATAAFKNPPKTINDVLDSLARSGAPNAAALLRP
ncbi:PIN domain-containing protein [Corynebacterium testudinoris]|uniref:PIN domain n=1 Tax=Corynebacterium testudinoris TaxID=136857 RepID=A0A0G3H812_9CORY|nr:PIN domain-containing protein [Corynebacterium testudinoris]AKK07973.1 PIN domain [Corynebacterium testudinoris]MBX8995595.1 PIN domain-containing protein [Corynebacterium testudinoris]